MADRDDIVEHHHGGDSAQSHSNDPVKIADMIENADKTVAVASNEDSSSSNSVDVEANNPPARRRRWYVLLNPLAWSRTPPVPTQRLESRERSAGILSILTFQWITPLMTVSCLLSSLLDSADC